MDKIKDRLKFIRKINGLTQSKFARKIKKSVKTVQQWEQEKRIPSDLVLLSISIIFDVSFEWLRYRNGTPFDSSSNEKYMSSFGFSAEKSVGDRIKKVRIFNRLSRKEFGKIILKSEWFIRKYELGKEVPNEVILSLISVIFRIDFEWLRTGIGEMIDFSKQKKFNHFFSETISLFNKLSPEKQNKVFEYIKSLQQYRKLDEKLESKKII